VDIEDRPTRARVIDVSHDLPNAERLDPDLDGRDRATSSGPGAPGATAQRDGRAPAPRVGRDALAKLARLLGRQAAQEHIRSKG
jgi:hypothetical protein